MADPPTVRVPTVIVAHHRLVTQGWVPPLVVHHCWLGESSFCADACLVLLLDRDAGLCSLIGVGPRLIHWH
jgi:hypothetical protein